VKMRKKIIWGVIFLVILLVIIVAAIACKGPAGPAGPAGPTGPTGPAGPAGQAVAASPLAAIQPVAVSSTQLETCGVCHKDQGAKHQASYDELYQDGVIKVTDLKYSFSPGPDTTRITFKMTKNGVPFDGREADSLNIYFAPYNGAKFQFEPSGDRLALKGTLTYDGVGGITSTLVEKASSESGYVDYSDVSKMNGLIVVYGRDETVGRLPDTRVDQNKYSFAALMKQALARRRFGCQ
jgi:hypothetical protein